MILDRWSKYNIFLNPRSSMGRAGIGEGCNRHWIADPREVGRLKGKAMHSVGNHALEIPRLWVRIPPGVTISTQHREKTMETMEKQIINLTPHTLTICDQDCNFLVEISPEGVVARVDVQYQQEDVIGDIPVFEAKYGDITGLPSPQGDVVYVVSGMVNARVNRDDVYSPGKLIRDEDGNPVGCKGLKQ